MGAEDQGHGEHGGSCAKSGGSEVSIRCVDGTRLVGEVFDPVGDPTATAVIAPATGVRASYYRRYAGFLARRGMRAVTFDYRGIGRSAPDHRAGLRRLRVRWHDWGVRDLDAVIRWAQERSGVPGRLVIVGHSFGGVAALLAPRARQADRMLLVGAQHAHWRDYVRKERLRMVWRWHVVMPIVTAVVGYFPGRRLGWLEDLPRGVAFDWARGRARLSRTIGRGGAAVLADAARVDADILAVASTDDPFATEQATDRTLALVPRARTRRCRVDPVDHGLEHIGHAGLFHDRFCDTLWPRSAAWLEGADAALPGTDTRGSAS